jgi:hypothetical protein
MSNGIPTTPPPTSTKDWGAMVRRYWGDAWLRREEVYIFSNGRKFDDSGDHAGIYTGTGT